MATKRWTEAEARSVMGKWKQSGKSAREYAKEQSVEVQRCNQPCRYAERHRWAARGGRAGAKTRSL